MPPVSTHARVEGRGVFSEPLTKLFVYGYTDDEYEPDLNVTLISKLDVSHPLYLHPNDSFTLTIVSIKLKGAENYNVWACSMLLALEGRNKTGFIDNTYRSEESHKVVVIGSGARTSQRSQSSVFNSSVNNRGNNQRPQTFGNTSRTKNVLRYNNNENKGILVGLHWIKVSHPNGTKAFITKSYNEGSNSSNHGSPTFNLLEDNLGHPKGSNGSASENEMAVTFENDFSMSEGDIADIPNVGPNLNRSRSLSMYKG
nr:ribonuclease H-like domain-containing protein [Tanacetum cinerariifolium]